MWRLHCIVILGTAWSCMKPLNIPYIQDGFLALQSLHGEAVGGAGIAGIHQLAQLQAVLQQSYLKLPKL